jgi:gliding motility-associated protein GldM
MVGEYETLPIDESGMGIYRSRASSLGDKTWGGLIKVKAPDGSVISYPFEGSYTVAPPNVVVSPTAMNVFYVGVDNPVDISVPGGQRIQATMTNGRIRPGRHPRFRSTFIVQPSRPGVEANVTVSAEVNGERRSFPPVSFRVKRVPDPVAKVGGSKGGNIDKGQLTAQQGVIAELENFDFDLTFRVTGFKVSINSQGYMIDEESNNNRFTQAQKALLDRLRRNQSVLISDIQAVGPDGSTRQLPPIAFKIQ